MMRRVLMLLLALALTGCAGTAEAPEAPLPPQEAAPLQSEAAPQQESVSLQQETAPPRQEAVPPQPETTVQMSPEQIPQQPPELLELMEQAGAELGQIEGGQLIAVSSEGAAAQLWGYELLENGQWQLTLGPASGHVGKNGVAADKREGDKKTPAGLFPLTRAFGIRPDPGSTLPYRQVTADSYWVDDPASRFYNPWVEGTEERDWSSAEHLADYDAQYAYAVVVDYNVEPVVPGGGSAIFLHCGTRPTAGCISVPEEDLLAFLKWLEPDRQPVIVIV